MALLLGIDIGTSGTKTALFSERRALASCTKNILYINRKTVGNRAG